MTSFVLNQFTPSRVIMPLRCKGIYWEWKENEKALKGTRNPNWMFVMPYQVILIKKKYL